MKDKQEFFRDAVDKIAADLHEAVSEMCWSCCDAHFVWDDGCPHANNLDSHCFVRERWMKDYNEFKKIIGENK